MRVKKKYNKNDFFRAHKVIFAVFWGKILSKNCKNVHSF